MKNNSDKINYCYLSEKENIKYYFYGRHAMYAALKLLGISKDDTVLTPAWDCDGALKPFRKMGCKLVFYRSDPYTFSVDLCHLQSLITVDTKLIHIINHFGHSQPWDKIIKLRNEKNIPILEDNAYSFSGGIEGSELGTFGDVAFFSFRKILPVTSGAVLKINRDSIFFNDGRRPFLYFIELKQIPYLLLDVINHNL